MINNYVHLTVIQMINNFFYILIYPFVFNKIGALAYGEYVYVASIAALLSIFVSFGFDLHATKLVANGAGREEKSNLLSNVTAAKLMLEVVAVLVFVFLLLFLRPTNVPLYWACFIGTLSAVFTPSWFYHGIQKLHVVTVVQIFIKVISLPLIFYYIKDAGSVAIYAALVSGANVVSSLFLFYISLRFFDLKLRLPSFQEVLGIIKEVKHFFWSNSIVAIKQRSVEILVGMFFGMKEVAIYDVANKLFSVGSLIVSNINSAMFPKLSSGVNARSFRAIITYELVLCFIFILAMAMFSGKVIDFFLGREMMEAYGLSVIMSLNVIAYLVVGSYIYFVFIPGQRYDLVLKNQIVSVSAFIVFLVGFLFIDWSVSAVVLALVGSGLVEVVFCWALYKKVKVI